MRYVPHGLAVKFNLAIVDPHYRVIGLKGLRVINSSIIPLLTMGNINAPSLLIGETGADHLLGRTPLAPSNDEPAYHPHWQTAQRSAAVTTAEGLNMTSTPNRWKRYVDWDNDSCALDQFAAESSALVGLQRVVH